MSSFGIHSSNILWEMLNISTLDMSLQITDLRFQPYLPVANGSKNSTSHNTAA